LSRTRPPTPRVHNFLVNCARPPVESTFPEWPLSFFPLPTDPRGPTSPYPAHAWNLKRSPCKQRNFFCHFGFPSYHPPLEERYTTTRPPSKINKEFPPAKSDRPPISYDGALFALPTKMLLSPREHTLPPLSQNRLLPTSRRVPNPPSSFSPFHSSMVVFF